MHAQNIFTDTQSEEQDKTHHTGRVCLTYNCMAFAKTLARERGASERAHSCWFALRPACLCKICCLTFLMTAGHRTSHVWRDSPLMSSSLALVKPLSLRLYVYLLGHLPHAASEFSLAARHIIYDIVCARDSTLAFCIFACRRLYLVPSVTRRWVLYAAACARTHPSMCRLIGSLIQFMRPNAPTCDVGSSFSMKGLHVLCNRSHQIKVFRWQ